VTFFVSNESNKKIGNTKYNNIYIMNTTVATVDCNRKVLDLRLCTSSG
jgi:hypothetical protein